MLSYITVGIEVNSKTNLPPQYMAHRLSISFEESGKEHDVLDNLDGFDSTKVHSILTKRDQAVYQKPETSMFGMQGSDCDASGFSYGRGVEVQGQDQHYGPAPQLLLYA